MKQKPTPKPKPKPKPKLEIESTAQTETSIQSKNGNEIRGNLGRLAPQVAFPISFPFSF